MALWKEPVQQKKEPDPGQAVHTPAFATNESAAPDYETLRAAANPSPMANPGLRESVIASDISIEGKIQGAGHVRIAGRFKGDVDVKGDLTIEQGAKLDGEVRAQKVIVSGALDGNIVAAERVELMASCAMNGDIKAGTLTVAAGSRLRGHVECGSWDTAVEPKTAKVPNRTSDEADSPAA